MHYTPKQLRVMEFIRDFRAEHRVSPTLEELAGHLGVTKPTAFGHIEALIRKGALRKTRAEARSLDILDPEFAPPLRSGDDLQGVTVPAARVPLLGRIAAGRPIEALEDSEPLDVSDLFPARENCYALKVEGNSMIEDGIRDGDFVIVENRRTASNGETVVAIIGDNEATLKRFYREHGRVRLQPANPAIEPIYVDHCEIRGVVLSVHRRY
jgi:repressor LexA